MASTSTTQETQAPTDDIDGYMSFNDSSFNDDSNDIYDETCKAVNFFSFQDDNTLTI